MGSEVALSDSWNRAARKRRMLVIGRNRSSAPGALRRDRITHPMIRKTFALTKSLGPTLYLISVVLIAAWVIGVFFGAGLLPLMHPYATKKAPQFGLGEVPFSGSLAEAPSFPQSITEVDELPPPPPEVPPGNQGGMVAAPDQKSGVYQDPQLAGPVEPFADPKITETEGSPLSPQNRPIPLQLPGSLTDTQPTKESRPRTAALPKRSYQIRATSAQNVPVHPPMQAIQDLLQKQPGLLK